MAVENALRCVVDMFQVLQLNRIPPGRLRWVYHGAYLHCERRADGACLGVFLSKEAEAVDHTGLERCFREFRALAQTPLL
jgi:hypothetical protein